MNLLIAQVIDTDGGLEDCAGGLLNNHILVVDDSSLSRNILGACLRGAGYHNIAYAGDDREALVAMDAEAPDLVVLDLEMSVMDGFELCRYPRLDEARKIRHWRPYAKPWRPDSRHGVRPWAAPPAAAISRNSATMPSL